MKLGSSSIVTVQFVATVMAYFSQIHNFLAGLPTAAVTITALSSQENSLSDFNGDDKQTTLALSTKNLSAHRVEKAWAWMAMKRWKCAHMNAWHIN